jgi:tetratricopeptide (TPR) repeat protein
VVRKSPLRDRGHNNLGNSYLLSGELERAIKEYETVLMLNPRHREAHNNLGNAYFRMVRMDKAIENYKIALTRLSKSAVKLFTSEAAYKAALVNFGLAEAYKSSGQMDMAIEHYREAISLKPDYPEAHYGLGTIYYWKDMHKEARKEIETVLSLEPDNYAARQFLEGYLKQ